VLRCPHFLENWLIGSGKRYVPAALYSQEYSKNIPCTHFCWRLSRSQGHSAAGRIRSNEKSNDLIRTRTSDLPACSIVPQPTTLPRAPNDVKALAKTIFKIEAGTQFLKTDFSIISFGVSNQPNYRLSHFLGD
jgi:hypothetical protein